MPRRPLAQQFIADISFRERQPGEEAFDAVQWQMPSTLLRRFQAEARRRQTDLNSLLRDVVCAALTERAAAIRRVYAALEPGSTPTAVTTPAPPAPAAAPIPPLSHIPKAHYDAQDLIYQAWEAPTKAQQLKLARQALALWPDCADAYNLFAEHAGDLTEQRRLYTLALETGARALGPAVFEQERGHFWLLLESRPYMRARQGLAYTLWQLGERQAAIAHLWAMLDLNPGDNQGMRYWLASWLLAGHDAAGMERLLALYPDEGSAALAYPAALHRFRGEGASRRANAALRWALRVNAFVPAYLLGLRPLPAELPKYIGMGDEREAEAYAAEAMPLWTETSDALAWLAAVEQRMRRRQR